ncbi:protein kinase domain-containing protein [Nocardia takedensis]|uniref:serine/threonine-protein kinase n=1 Tax=Nocardia takedensis TaxID=259390 RepID=UPI003F75A053
MLNSGDVFAGYTVERLLGQGGMGSVYLARQPRFARRTALKLLNPELFTDAEVRARFEREADLVAQLDHPAIVTVYDRGSEHGQLWIAMQYIDGVDAAAVNPLTLPPERAVQIIEGVADALDYAHGMGVLHRDVKPANIMLARASGGQKERVFLTDFGIARLREDSTHLTQTGMFTATLAYASPEQMTGGRLDPRTDQYALACALYWLLAGVGPFDADNPADIIKGHLHLALPPLAVRRPGLNPALDAVLAAGMAKLPEYRYATCADFAAAARHALTTTSGPRLPPPQMPYQGMPQSTPGVLPQSAPPGAMPPQAGPPGALVGPYGSPVPQPGQVGPAVPQPGRHGGPLPQPVPHSGAGLPPAAPPPAMPPGPEPGSGMPPAGYAPSYAAPPGSQGPQQGSPPVPVPQPVPHSGAGLPPAALPPGAAMPPGVPQPQPFPDPSSGVPQAGHPSHYGAPPGPQAPPQQAAQGPPYAPPGVQGVPGSPPPQQVPQSSPYAPPVAQGSPRQEQGPPVWRGTEQASPGSPGQERDSGRSGAEHASSASHQGSSDAPVRGVDLVKRSGSVGTEGSAAVTDRFEEAGPGLQVAAWAAREQGREFGSRRSGKRVDSAAGAVSDRSERSASGSAPADGAAGDTTPSEVRAGNTRAGSEPAESEAATATASSTTSDRAGTGTEGDAVTATSDGASGDTVGDPRAAGISAGRRPGAESEGGRATSTAGGEWSASESDADGSAATAGGDKSGVTSGGDRSPVASSAD